MVIKEAQKREALERLKILKVHENVLSDFKDGVINATEPLGFLYWVDEDEKQIIREYEERTGYMVYHAIRCATQNGNQLLTLLYVSKSPGEWEEEQFDFHDVVPVEVDGRELDALEVCSYTYNRTDPMLSEMGYVGIWPLIGGVVRVY